MVSTSSSMAALLSRRLLLTRALFSTPKPSNLSSMPFSSAALSSSEDSDSPDPFRALDLDSDSVGLDSPSPLPPSSSSSSDSAYQQRMFFDRPLENGLDIGIYKAILVGQVGQSPLQKRLRSGKNVVMFSLGTGGIRNNRRPLDNEEPRDYANRCAVQWHRVSVYPDRLGDIAMKHVLPGSILYLEGNLETKIFTDPVTGLVRRIREIAIRANGRIVFLSNGGDAQQAKQSELKGVGYY